MSQPKHLSDNYDQVYLNMLLAFQSAAKLHLETPNEASYVNFYPSFGIEEGTTSDLLIYGQAVNGWSTSFTPDKKLDLSFVKESHGASNDIPAMDGFTPLDWVNIQWTPAVFNAYLNELPPIRKWYQGDPSPYAPYRSFFWNVVYKFVSDYHQLDRSGRDWAKKLIWSNLYKIAPSNANPGLEEQQWQFEHAAALVKMELEELQPEYCVVMTNESWWVPFREKLGSHLRFQPRDPRIESVENFGKTTIIVTTRSFRGNSNGHVESILKVIQDNVH